MLNKKNFLKDVVEIVAEVSKKTGKHYAVTDADRDVISVVASKAEDIKDIAYALCERDLFVEYASGSYTTTNFVRVSPNYFPTPEKFALEITKIPIGFEQALQLVKDSKFGVVVETTANGSSHVTVIGNSATNYDDLRDIVHALCKGGIKVKYYGCGNFFEFYEVDADEIAMPSVKDMDVVAV